MENYPLVTVMVPSYNHEKYIESAIQSIIDQDYENIELIVIDDGSRDNSANIIRALIPQCEKRFKRFEFRSRPNKGLCRTLNEALDWSQGQYFSATASDDMLDRCKVSAQVQAFAQKTANVRLVGVFAGLAMIDEQGKVLRTRGRDECFGFREVMRRTAFMPGSAVMFVTEALKQVGGYNSDYKIEDLYMALKLSSIGGHFLSIKRPLVLYRRHDDNFSSKSDLIWEAVKKIIDDYREHDLYRQGLAFSQLIQAHDVQGVSKKASLSWGWAAMKTYPLCVFSRSFIWWIAKFLR